MGFDDDEIPRMSNNGEMEKNIVVEYGFSNFLGKFRGKFFHDN